MSWHWGPECLLHVSVDFPSTPCLSFVQLLVLPLLIQEGTGVWTALSWQLLSELHLVKHREESLLVLAWLMGWEGCVLGVSRVMASCLGQAVAGLRGRVW